MHRSPAAILNRPISSEVDTSIHQPRDPNTLSNYNAWRTKHVTADLEIDFRGQRVWGSVTMRMERLAKGVGKVVLDTRLVNSLPELYSLYGLWFRGRICFRRNTKFRLS